MKQNRSPFCGFLYVTGILMMLNLPGGSSASPPSSQSHQALLSHLDELLQLLDVPHGATLDEMIVASQIWRRKPGQERWEVPDLNITRTTRQNAFQLLEKLGMVQEILPTRNQYQYALLLGATVPRMQRRLNELLKLWQQGIRFEQLVFLVGQRPLQPDIDLPTQFTLRAINNAADVNSLPATETEGAKMIYSATLLPNDLKRIPVLFVDTPRYWRENGWQRPNTRDTLKQWVSSKPIPGSTLVLSDQPHSHYQKEVVRQELPDGFSVDLAAHQADPDARLVLYLDALALWLHNMSPAPAPGRSETPLPPRRH
ncbi:MAG: hypothetical protein ACPG5T_10835 [Endozoicomonas sp.]